MKSMKAHIRLPVVPPSVAQEATVLIAEKGMRGPHFQDGGGIALHCGSCLAVLADGMAPGQIRNLVLGCPQCGVYNAVVDIPVIEHFASQLLAADLSKNSLPKFKKVLSDGISSQSPAAYVAEKIEQSLPEFSWFQKYLVPANAGETYALLGCILAFVTWWQTRPKKGKDQPAMVINNYVYDSNPYRGIGPNVLCPCGSGQKFKCCHGNQANSSLA